MIIDNDALKALENFKLPEEDIGFGQVMAPILISSDYRKGAWGEPRMTPYRPLSIDPTCKALHYAQEIFEGMKAYRGGGGSGSSSTGTQGPFLFRPERNLQRFNYSAQRLGMPSVPEEFFMAAVEGITRYCAPFIPSRSEYSLYIRPFMFATEENLGIKPSETFKFMTIASPSAPYFSGGHLSVMIEREMVRACPGGVGRAKTGGNYASSIGATVKAQKAGFMQPLWLDAMHHRYIEEFSGMNFFCVIEETLCTPELTDSILNGITRDSLITLARHQKREVREQKISIDELIRLIQEKKCTEAFACGTATTITPIECLGEMDGTRYHFPQCPGEMGQSLRQSLLAIQEGEAPDPFGWAIEVK